MSAIHWEDPREFYTKENKTFGTFVLCLGIGESDSIFFPIRPPEQFGDLLKDGEN